MGRTAGGGCSETLDRFWRHRGQIAPKRSEHAVTHTGIWTAGGLKYQNRAENTTFPMSSIQIPVWVTACSDRFGAIWPRWRQNIFEQAVTHTGISLPKPPLQCWSSFSTRSTRSRNPALKPFYGGFKKLDLGSLSGLQYGTVH